MKKEHYDHVVVHFKLWQYHTINEHLDENNKINVGGLSIRRGRTMCYIGDYRDPEDYDSLIVDLPTKELAEEILQYIKDTEILFI